MRACSLTLVLRPRAVIYSTLPTYNNWELAIRENDILNHNIQYDTKTLCMPWSEGDVIFAQRLKGQGTPDFLYNCTAIAFGVVGAKEKTQTSGTVSGKINCLFEI